MSMAPLDFQNVRQQIDSANRRFMDAFNAGDIEGAAQGVYTRDARVLPPDAQTVQGRDDIARFWVGAAQQLGLRRVELSSVEVQPQGDGAYEIGRAVLTLEGGQQAEAKFVVIWKQEDGAWRWDVDIWNMNGA